MALFVDGPLVTVDLLAEYDSNVLTVSAAEGINLTTKISLAQEAMHLELQRLIRRSEFSSEHWLWVSRRGVENVVWSKGLRVWQVYESLAQTYRDAYYSQLNDRHRARAEEYVILANRSRRDLVEFGLGLVSYPIHRPAQPVASYVPASENGGTFYFAVSCLNELTQESAASSLLSVDVTDGNAADLTLSIPIAPNVLSWNIYAGMAPEQMVKQNDQPLVPGSDWCYLPSLAVTSGRGLPDGQNPDQHWPLNQYMQRG